MVQVKIVKEEKSLSEVYAIWKEVFKRNTSDLVYNESNIYIILYEGLKEDSPIGAAMIKIEKDHCYIENLAIIDTKRNQKNGEFLLRFAIDKAFQMEYDKIYANIKSNQDGLFKKIGFQMIEDDKTTSNMAKHQIIKENFYKKCSH